MKEILKKKDAMKNVNNQKPTHILRGGIIHLNTHLITFAVDSELVNGAIRVD